MFSYQKRLLFPVHVEQPNQEYADILAEHYGGKEGEFISFLRYTKQRLYFCNPYVRDLIGMIAAEELSHMELIGTAIKKLGGTESGINTLVKISWNIPLGGSSKNLVEMLKLDKKAEAKSQRNYRADLEKIHDIHLIKLLNFLIKREGIHENLIKKTADLISREAGNEQFAALIHSYRMSLRVVE